MSFHRSKRTERAERIVVEGHIDGLSRDRIVDAIVRLAHLTRLEAHRLFHGWTREQVSYGIDELYRHDGLKSPRLSTSEVCRWELGRIIPSTERQDYLARLYRTRHDRLGFSRDYSDPPAPVAIEVAGGRGCWTPDGHGGGVLVISLSHNQEDPSMSAHPITQVALYAATRGGSVRAAVFRWSEADGVTMEVIDQRWKILARSVYDQGAPSPSRGPVQRTEGQRFMRALLAYDRATYFGYKDESHMEHDEVRP